MAGQQQRRRQHLLLTTSSKQQRRYSVRRDRTDSRHTTATITTKLRLTLSERTLSERTLTDTHSNHSHSHRGREKRHTQTDQNSVRLTGTSQKKKPPRDQPPSVVVSAMPVDRRAAIRAHVGGCSPVGGQQPDSSPVNPTYYVPPNSPSEQCVTKARAATAATGEYVDGDLILLWRL